MTKLFNNLFIACDAPRPLGTYFQDSASPKMEALVELHDNIMFYLVIILFGVGWILFCIIRNYVNDKSFISNKYLNHGTLIELIWTITPALILILIAFPSFKLLFLMDEGVDPSLIVFVEGHQWCWSYLDPDFINDDEEEFVSDLCLFATEAKTAEEAAANAQEIADAAEALARQANCAHDSCFPYPSDAPTPILCDLNPDIHGVQHDAIRGGVLPIVCNNCHLILCRDCTNPDYDSE